MSGMHNDEANCLLTRKRPDCHHQYAYKALSTGSSMYAWIPVLLTRVYISVIAVCSWPKVLGNET